jgi:hypothetical protein
MSQRLAPYRVGQRPYLSKRVMVETAGQLVAAMQADDFVAVCGSLGEVTSWPSLAGCCYSSP